MKIRRTLRGITWVVLILLAGATHAEWTPEQQELISLCNEWIAAEVGQDSEALARILDERFLATFASGRTVDRSSFIAGIMKRKLDPFEVIHEVVNVHGNTAVVIDITTDGSMKFTWIAVRKERGWKVISETFSRVAGKPSLDGVVFKGGNGAGCSERVEIQGVSNDDQAGAAVDQWLARNYSGYERQSASHDSPSDCPDSWMVTIRNKSGDERSVYFHVTSEVDKP